MSRTWLIDNIIARVSEDNFHNFFSSIKNKNQSDSKQDLNFNDIGDIACREYGRCPQILENMNILVAVDLSSASNKILVKAKALALALTAKVCILHVVEDDPDFLGHEPTIQDTNDQRPQEFPHEHKRLQQDVDELRKAGIDTKGLLAQGSVVDVILQKSKQLESDIIIVGTHGHGGVHHMIFGSVSEGVLRNSSCPVLVIPTHERK